MDRFLHEFFNIEVIREMFPEILTEAAKNTIVFTAISFTAGLLLGLVLALMRHSRRRLLRWPAAVYVDVFRGLPALLVIVFVGYGLPVAVGVRFPYEKYTPGCLALAMVSSAYLAETIRAGIEAVPQGQVEAARAVGLTEMATLQTVVLPQAFRIIVPPLTNELVMLLKDTALLAALGTLAGGKELTKFGRDLTNTSANTSPLVAVGLVYLLITIPLIRLSARLEARRDAPGRRRRALSARTH